MPPTTKIIVRSKQEKIGGQRASFDLRIIYETMRFEELSFAGGGHISRLSEIKEATLVKL